MGAHAGPNIIEDGLVLYLDAANTRSYPGSGTTWFDLSGNGNNGTLVNGVGFNIDNKGTLAFDGINDNALITSLATLSNVNITVSAWFKPIVASSTNDLETIVCRFHGSNLPTFRLTYGAWNINNDTTPRFEIHNGAFRAASSQNQLPLNQWVNLVATYSSINGGEINLYINGENEATNSGVGSLQAYNNNRIYIGSTDITLDGSRFYGGANITNVSLYNRALTAAEVRQNFKATRGRYNL